MPFSILPVITGVPLVPFPLTIALVGFVVRVAAQFLLLPRSLPDTLALLGTAVALIFYTWIGLEIAPAMNALDCPAHGCPPRGDNHSAPYGAKSAGKGRKRRESKNGSRKILHAQKEEETNGRLPDRSAWPTPTPSKVADFHAAANSERDRDSERHRQAV